MLVFLIYSFEEIIYFGTNGKHIYNM